MKTPFFRNWICYSAFRNWSFSAMIKLAVLGLLCFPFGLQAQTTLPINETITVGTLTSTDYMIPEGIDSLTIEVRGADGGNARLSGPCDTRVRGGQGATMKVTFKVGPDNPSNPNELKYNGLIRVFAGRAGQNDDSGCAPVPVGRYGAGGGASAILYQPPFRPNIDWRLLAVAGGGGGGARVAAGIFRNGLGGNAFENGDNTGGASGGINGNCGQSSQIGSSVFGYGGGGINCDPSDEAIGKRMVQNGPYYAGSPQVVSMYLRPNSYATSTGGTKGIQPIGGDGFSGGATGAGGGGGGGGFSGGAGASTWPGGGGGSYISPAFLPINIARQAGANGASTNHPTQGYVKMTAKSNCPLGDVQLGSQEDIEDFVANFPNCTDLPGNLTIGGLGITDLRLLANIKSVGGEVLITHTFLNSLDGLSNLQTVGGLFSLVGNERLSNLSGLSALTSIGNSFRVLLNYGITEIGDISNLNFIGGNVEISGNSQLTNFDGLCPFYNNGTLVGESFIGDNPVPFQPDVYCPCLQDGEAPEISCPENTTKEITSTAFSYFVQGNELDAYATDNCQVASITNSLNNTSSLSGAQLSLGANEIIWTAVDTVGNTSSCTTQVVVEYPEEDYFVTTWQTTSANESITIPTTGGGYNYLVDWGDGTVETGQTDNATHSYVSPGTHTVRILGAFPQIYFYDSGIVNSRKLQTIEQWGAIDWRSMYRAFWTCRNLNITNPDIDKPKLANVTDISFMFWGAYSFNGQIGHWNVSTVRNMQGMFDNAFAFNQYIGDWDVSNVQNMSYMFANTDAFNQEIGNWDVSNVTNISHMFSGAIAFNQDIGDWNVGKVTTMEGLFGRAAAFNQPIGNWDLSNIQNMNSMFSGAEVFNQYIGDWDVSNVEEMLSVFAGAKAFNQDIGDWDVSKVATMQGMFRGASVFNQDIEKWDVGAVTDMISMFLRAEAFNQDIGGWDVSKVEQMIGMFLGASSFNQDIGNWDVGNVKNMYSMFENAFSFNQNIGNWNVGEATVMINMFKGAQAFNQDIGNWEVSKVELMASMFENASSFDQNIGNWNIENVRSMFAMFKGVTLSSDNYDALLIGWSTQNVQPNVRFDAGKSKYCEGENAKSLLESVPNNWIITDGDLLDPLCGTRESDLFVTTWRTTRTDESITIPTEGGGYNFIVDWGDGTVETDQTGNTTHTYTDPGTYTVRIAGDFPQIFFDNSGDKDKILTVEQWGSIEWRSMANAFMGCSNLNITNSSIDSPDLSNVTDISYVFGHATSFNGPIGNWDVSNVINMQGVFFYANAFNQDISNWEVNKVTAMDYMFFEAREFNQNIGGWNVSNVVGMELMFFFAHSFNQPIGNWDVGNVKYMRAMFERARAFNQPIGNWNVSKVENMSSMFKLADVFNQNIGQWNTESVTSFKRMFQGALVFDQNIGEWNVENVLDMELMFEGTTLSTANYDALLIGWSTQDLQANLIFDAGGSKYCEGENAKTILTSTPNNWIITDGDVDPTCPPMAVCQDLSIELDDSGIATITPGQIDMGSSSPLGDVDLSLDISIFGCRELGENTVTLTVTDVNDNSSTCTSTVTVIYIEPQISVASVGDDQFVCENYSFPLSGNDPLEGTGLWTGPDGIIFSPNANDPNATAQNLPLGTSTLRWTVSGGICEAVRTSASLQVARTEISSIVPISQTACDPWTNTYSQTLEITHFGAPSTGFLSVNGQQFLIGASPQTVVLTNLISDGAIVDVTAFFTDRATCSTTINGLFTAPADCSIPCDILSVTAGERYDCDSNGDTYKRDLMVEYQGTNLTGSFMVSIDGGNSISYPILSQSPQILTLTNLPSNGQDIDIDISISQETNCSWSATDFFQNPQFCGDDPAGDCDISALDIGEQRCNFETETYDQDLIITYSNAPGSGSILLKVNGQSDRESFPITGSPQVLTLEGRTPGEGAVDIFVKFSDDNGCTFSATDLFSAPEECILPCAITSMAAGVQSPCDPITNTFSQELVIMYENEPDHGSLIVNGQSFSITGSPQVVILNSLTANGNWIDINASFSQDNNCELIEEDFFQAPDACVQAPTGGNVLFVLGNEDSPANGDNLVKQRLESLGYTVMLKGHNDVSSTDANGKELILISNSVSASNIGTTFTNVSVPLINWESYLYDELGMTADGAIGTDNGEFSIDIDQATHQMAAGQHGEAQIFNSSAGVQWATPNNNAIKVASTQGNYSDQIALFGYDTGVNMVSGTAPARRVGIFLKESEVSKLNSNGWALFDAAVCWATDCHVQMTRVASQSVLNTNLPYSFKAYPNPLEGQLTIEWGGAAQEVQLELRNLFGQKVFNQKVLINGSHQIQVSDLPEGIYILQLTADGFKKQVKMMKK